eukprot:scaffold22029_cov92-Attheya_sp.AAC.1
MGIDKTDLDVDRSCLIVKYIQEDGSGSPNLRHGHMYYRAKHLMAIALSRRKKLLYQRSSSLILQPICI